MNEALDRFWRESARLNELKRIEDEKRREEQKQIAKSRGKHSKHYIPPLLPDSHDD